MKKLDKNSLMHRLHDQAYNSSHYVWLWSDLNFIESSSGWIFSYVRFLGIFLIALEPLPPENKKNDDPSFNEAFVELKSYLGNGTIAFVAIYEPFAKFLNQYGFTGFQIGKEPWAKLADIKPTGHASRKIRVAINQSTKAGLRIEEWKLSEILSDANKLSQLENLKKTWEEQSIIALSGFLHGISFETIPEKRKCFVALTPDNKVEGFLLATPIVKNSSWYLEDTIINFSSTPYRGVSELLTLHAMEFLQQENFHEVSLGIVPLTTIGFCEFGNSPPVNFMNLLSTFQKGINLFYNSSGLELFRRRFKLDRWDKIYLSALIDQEKFKYPTIQWIKILIAIGLAYKPKLQIRPSFIFVKLSSTLKRYSITTLFVVISTFLFFLLNNADNALFSIDDPIFLWPAKSIISTFMYYSSYHFALMILSIGGLVSYIEKEVYAKKWVVIAFAFSFLNDVFFRTSIGLSNLFSIAQNEQHTLMQSFPEAGGSILLTTLLGFSLTFSGQKKEKLFAIGFFSYLLSIIIVPFFKINSLTSLIHIIYYVEGFLLGRFYLLAQSQKDQEVAKLKNSVHANH